MQNAELRMKKAVDRGSSAARPTDGGNMYRRRVFR
jgi:hypothetical protein